MIPLGLANGAPDVTTAITISEVAAGRLCKNGRCGVWLFSQIGQQLASSQINDDRSGDRNVSSGKRTNGGFRARPGRRRAPQLQGSLGTDEAYLKLLLSDRLVVQGPRDNQGRQGRLSGEAVIRGKDRR
jgi:hypothetical protein